MFLSVCRGGKTQRNQIAGTTSQITLVTMQQTLLGSMPVIAVGLSTQRAVDREWLSASVLLQY